MISRRVLTLLVVVLMVTAGCLGGGGDAASDSGSGDAGDGDIGNSGMDDADDADDGDAAAGTDELELTDAEEALREAGSFTVTWTYSGVDVSGTETEVNREFSANLDDGRSLSVVSSMRDGVSDAGSSETFVADGVTYVRSGPAESPSYFSYEGDSGDLVGTALALSQARAYSADDDMTFVGDETFDGVAVERYELSAASSQLIQAGSVAGAAASAGPNTEITDFRYVILVDEDGLTRFESWSFTGETDEGQTVSGEWEYSVTALGTTTVDDPDWLAEAKAQMAG